MAKAKAKAKAPAAKTVDDIDPIPPSLFEALDIVKSIEANPANRSDGSVAYMASKGQLDELRALIEAIK
tara:strand:+ start:677 stop:883 length:207 start_codon:yes stop_codon:yes gene_type:complete